MKDSLGDRIKHNYENRNRSYLLRRTPVIMRLDGKAFHTLTRNCNKPFDIEFSSAMIYAGHKLLKEIQGAECAYTQSDEISILITDYETLETEAWFDYNVQKMTSVAASVASLAFSDAYKKRVYLIVGYLIFLKKKYVIILYGDRKIGLEILYRCWPVNIFLIMNYIIRK